MAYGLVETKSTGRSMVSSAAGSPLFVMDTVSPKANPSPGGVEVDAGDVAVAVVVVVDGVVVAAEDVAAVVAAPVAPVSALPLVQPVNAATASPATATEPRDS